MGSLPTLPAANPQPSGPMTTSPGELTLNQSLATNPPPPGGLKANRTALGIQLNWEVPPAVTVPHHYSDTILYYKVYRHTVGGEPVFLERTILTTYLDSNAAAGTEYFYTVTAMHANQIESQRPDEVAVP
jgi:hypothetical protein